MLDKNMNCETFYIFFNSVDLEIFCRIKKPIL